MKKIFVIEDTSGSMSVLGKNAVTLSLINTIRLSKELNSAYADLTFKKIEWDGKSKIRLENQSSIILTDGYSPFSLLENLGEKTALVLCGLDSSCPKDLAKIANVKVFEAQDILEALDYVAG